MVMQLSVLMLWFLLL